MKSGNTVTYQIVWRKKTSDGQLVSFCDTEITNPPRAHKIYPIF